MFRTLLPILLAAAASLLASCAGEPLAPPPHRPSFSEAAFIAHVERLASDEFEGRRPGTRGEELTLDYLEQAFRQAGLAPGAGEGFRQAVPLVEITTRPDDTLEARSPGAQLSLRYGDDMVIWTRRPVPESRVDGAELVFAGYGIVAPEYGWNDYAGVDMQGKIAIVLVNDPGFATGDPQLFNGRSMTYYGRWTYKFEEGLRQGARAVLVVHETEPAAYPWEVVRNGAARPQFDLLSVDAQTSRLPLEGWVTRASAERLLALAGEDYARLKQAAIQHGFRARSLGVTASVGVRNAIRRGTSYNVVGVLPGSARPDECVIYTAHWDHLGRSLATGGADGIFNGASDNATGVAGLIELARAFGETRPRPERSILFVGFTAEENGLLGSAHFAEQPTVPLANIAGGINMDNLYPLGKTRDLTVIGYGASELEDHLRDAARKQGRELMPEPTPEKGFYYRSDHFNLAKQGVPMLYTKPGVNSPERGPDWGRVWLADYIANRYHKPSDEYDAATWDVSGILQDLEIYYDVGLAVANTTAWPNWRPGNEFRAIRDRSRSGVAP